MHMMYLTICMTHNKWDSDNGTYLISMVVRCPHIAIEGTKSSSVMFMLTEHWPAQLIRMLCNHVIMLCNHVCICTHACGIVVVVGLS